MSKKINQKYLYAGVLVVVVILVIAGIFLFSKNSATNKTITHEYFSFSIASNWEETESMSAFVYSPNNKDEESITILATSLGGVSFDLALPLQQSLEGAKISMPDLLVTKTTDWDNGKITGKEVQFTGTRQGVKLTTNQIFAMKNGVLYSITYVCVDECKNIPVFEGVKETFEPLL